MSVISLESIQLFFKRDSFRFWLNVDDSQINRNLKRYSITQSSRYSSLHKDEWKKKLLTIISSKQQGVLWRIKFLLLGRHPRLSINNTSLANTAVTKKGPRISNLMRSISLKWRKSGFLFGWIWLLFSSWRWWHLSRWRIRHRRVDSLMTLILRETLTERNQVFNHSGNQSVYPSEREGDINFFGVLRQFLPHCRC